MLQVIKIKSLPLHEYPDENAILNRMWPIGCLLTIECWDPDEEDWYVQVDKGIAGHDTYMITRSEKECFRIVTDDGEDLNDISTYEASKAHNSVIRAIKLSV